MIMLVLKLLNTVSQIFVRASDAKIRRVERELERMVSF
jgi:hypothetical protein